MTFTGTAPVGSPQVIKGTGSVTFTEQSTNTVAASLSVSAATLTTTTVSNVTTTVVNFGAIPSLTPGSQYIINAPQGLLTTDGTALSSTFCGKTTTTPRVARPSLAKTQSVIAQEELRITLVEFCPAPLGKSTKRTNIKITFNKPIRVKASSPAEVSIFGGVFGSLFQKIDLRGTFTSKKYGDIYEGAESGADNLDTANSEFIDDRTILVNPSQMMSGATNYYMNIPAGVIIDANCDLAWPGISDSTTIAWTTEGARMTAPTGDPLTYSSVKLRWKTDRKTVPGDAFVNITTSAGVFLTNVSAKDPVVKFQHNVPF